MDDRSTESNLIFGIHPLEEAITAKTTFTKVYVQKGIGDGIKYIKQILSRHKIIFTEVPKEKLDTLSKFRNHQGVVAKVSPVLYGNAEALVNEMLDNEQLPFIIALDRITDVRNFGAIARTAMAAGAHAIIIPEKGSVTVTDEAIKTSAGALMHIKVCKSSNMFQTIKHLKDAGLQIIAATEKANKEMYFETLQMPCVVMVGSEEDGIQNALLKLADKLVKIPMHSELDSLNVSVAAALVMYEVVRQGMVK
ncbi:MAG: 23S rRNA (guanosine(2251)-2'-O)-methyltransferase RlmB [Bacteroidota bacterium]